MKKVNGSFVAAVSGVGGAREARSLSAAAACTVLHFLLPTRDEKQMGAHYEGDDYQVSFLDAERHAETLFSDTI